MVELLAQARRVALRCSSACIHRFWLALVGWARSRALDGGELRWASTGGNEFANVVVHTVSGDVVLTETSASPGTPISKLVASIAAVTGTPCDLVKLISGSTTLLHEKRLGEVVSPPETGPLKLLLVRLPGPAIRAETMSGREIQVLDALPAVGDRCHLDRHYVFTSVGGFGQMENVHYVLTSNNDKITRPQDVMWKLHIRVPATVYLNFRGRGHVNDTGAARWLERDGWSLASVVSTISTGHPNGPYAGPVYQKVVEPGHVDLMGSNCDEGVYFVFIQLEY